LYRKDICNATGYPGPVGYSIIGGICTVNKFSIVEDMGFGISVCKLNN
jgi:hypothetical protein